MTKPKFINRGGELVYEPPFVADNVQQYSFLLDADIHALEKLCDRYFNDPIGEKRFAPGGAFVLLCCCGLTSLRSTTPPYSEMGWFAENEIAFWMLVIDKKKKRMFWTLPYIWVDNDYAFAMGRELYGFQKGMGTINLPKVPGVVESCSIDTLVLKKYSPETKGEIVRLVEVKKVPGEPPVKVIGGDVLEGIKELMKEVVSVMDDGLSMLGNAKLLMDSTDDLLHLRIPMIFLKEFRDVSNPKLASFQAIVETEAKMKKFHKGKILTDAYQIDIDICDSHPIREDLGLPLSGSLKSKYSFWVNYDFEIGKGTQTEIS
jgi:hypothetical protein